MKVYLAYIDYPYEDNASLIGIYTSEEKAQEAINKDLDRYNRLTNSDRYTANWIDEHEVDKTQE